MKTVSRKVTAKFRSVVGGKMNKSRSIARAAKNKIQSTAGDSIAEALVAVLVAALGASLLAIMVVSATDITTKNRVRMDAIYATENALEAKTVPATEGKITISAGTTFDKDVSVTVDVYEDKKEELIRYEASE